MHLRRSFLLWPIEGLRRKSLDGGLERDGVGPVVLHGEQAYAMAVR
jgi:hypothetical protein